MARMCKALCAAVILVSSLIVSVAASPLENAVSAVNEGDYATAHQLLRPLADNGDAHAQFNLGYLYANGWGVPRDYAEALSWYRKAADQGLPAAQHYLGIAYANGDGVPQDDAEAARWYRLAADQGYAAAQLNLGAAYADGRGVPHNPIAAYMWINLSAIQGNATAIRTRSRLAKLITPRQIAEAQKLAGEWRAKLRSEMTSPLAPQNQNKVQGTIETDHHYGQFADTSVWPISAVGAVTATRYGHKNYCTGTLVGPRLVLTAAHCLFIKNVLVNSADVRFLTALKRGMPATHSVAERLVVSNKFVPGDWNVEGSANDWAVIVLRDTLAIKPISVKSVAREQLAMLYRPGSILQVGYGIEHSYLPSIARDCRVTWVLENVFNFSCVTNFGYSGAPVLAEIDGKHSVIGIVSAGPIGSLRGFACSAGQFETAVSDLLQSELRTR